jgi:predicted secreted protein
MIKTGNKMRLYLTEAGGDTYTWLKGEQSHSTTFNSEMIDVSDKSTDWQQFIAGMKSGTAEVTVHADDDSSGPQHQLLQSLHRGQSVYVFSGILEDDTPAEGDMFEALVSSIGNTYDNNGVASRSISLQITGEVVHYPTFD